MPKNSTSQSVPLDALLSLMRDPDPRVWRSVEAQFLKLGEATRELLQATADGEENPLVQTRARAVLAKIHEAAVTDRFRLWADPDGSEPELEDGWFLLTQLEFPDLDVGLYRRKLDAMAADLDPQLRGAGDMEALRIFQRYLHSEKVFRGNVEHYYEAENSYLNCVLDRGLGIPITLSSIYLLIARRVGLPIEGIAAPGHFLVRYKRDRAGLEPMYINAYHGGSHLTREECVAFLSSIGHSVRGELDRPVASREILARMCRNLIAIYGSAGPAQKSERLTGWLEIIGAAMERPGGSSGGTF